MPGIKKKTQLGDDVLYVTGRGPVNPIGSMLAGRIVRGAAVVLFAFGVRGKIFYFLLRPGKRFLSTLL